MNAHTLKIERTARYFTLGEKTPETKQIWFVLHGYGQLASYFIQKFKGLINDETYIVAPEGLSRFYTEGSFSRVGASWTTKECLDNETEEYIKFLNEVYYSETRFLNLENVTITVLGFSQGCATAVRWLNDDIVKCNKLVLWAGLFKNGLSDLIELEKLDAIKVQYVYGNQDQFFKKHPEESLSFLEKIKEEIDVEVLEFNGKHSIDQQFLLEKVAK